MAKLNVAPTKSNYLDLTRRLALAEEGYDLLEQKRQILIFELMSRLGRARDAERRAGEAMARAQAALRDAMLAVGADALDRAALGVAVEHDAEIEEQTLMGIRLPDVAVTSEEPGAQFGVVGTGAATDAAMRRFADALEVLGELAELENAVLRLARELRKTQRRVNALSKIFIPNYTETVGYILANLEERERESLVIMKMVKARLAGEGEGGSRHG
ncbi:MAG: V-type ATP synthase subunit D [Planctomycetota bacterium]|nr:V-type ATP synthase subunit D [Planctomycetota bacterium]